MWVYDPNRVCNKCGNTNTAFLMQKQRGNQLTINNLCFMCRRRYKSIYYYKKEKLQRYHKDNMYLNEKV